MPFKIGCINFVTFCEKIKPKTLPRHPKTPWEPILEPCWLCFGRQAEAMLASRWFQNRPQDRKKKPKREPKTPQDATNMR